MPFYIVGGTPMHIRFSGRGKPPAACVAVVGLEGKRRRCCDISAFLCDWPVEGGATCDAPLCEAHAHQVAKNRHLCPDHQAEQLRLQPQLGLFTSLETAQT